MMSFMTSIILLAAGLITEREGVTMSDVPFVRGQFLEALNRLSDKDENAADLTRSLRKALLDFASKTPENINCAERIELGDVDDDTALKIVGRAVLFSEIAHRIEDEPMPASLRMAYPDLTEKEWDAFTRMTTLLYLLFSRPT